MRRKICIRCESTAPAHIEVGRITVSEACAFRVSTSLKCDKLSKCTEGEDAHTNTDTVVFEKERLALYQDTTFPFFCQLTRVKRTSTDNVGKQIYSEICLV